MKWHHKGWSGNINSWLQHVPQEFWVLLPISRMFSMNSLCGPGAAVSDSSHHEQRFKFSSWRMVLDSVQELQEFRRQQNHKLRKTARTPSVLFPVSLPVFGPASSPLHPSRLKPCETNCRLQRGLDSILGVFSVMEKGVNHWNRLLRAVVESPALEMFQKVWMWHWRTRCNGEHGGGAGFKV